MKNISKIKDEARYKLEGHWNFIIGAFVIYLIITSLLSSTGLGILLTGALSLGFSMIAIRIYNGEKTQVIQLFDGFNYFGNAILLAIIRGLIIFAWGLLVIPGIIIFSFGVGSESGGMIFIGLLLSILLMIPSYIAMLNYDLAFFVLAENPNLEFGTVLSKTKRLIDGNKARLFKLKLSFIGWSILEIVTLGIATLYVEPYKLMAQTVFYQELKSMLPEYISQTDSSYTKTENINPFDNF